MILLVRLDVRGRLGGVEKGGGWKTSRMTPLPKRDFGPPSYGTFSTPSGVSALFFLYKNPRQSRPEALLEGSKNFRESAFSGTFSSPHTFCTPHITAQNYFQNFRLILFTLDTKDNFFQINESSLVCSYLAFGVVFWCHHTLCTTHLTFI